MSDAEYVYAYSERAKMKGRKCRIMASGRMNTVLIQFLDTGATAAVSRRSLRKVK